MRQYYYAVTSLPMLSYESEHYPSMDDFLGLCRESLTSSDQAQIEEARIFLSSELQATAGKAALLFEDWIDWNRSLRADLALLRAQALRRGLEELEDISRITGTEEVAREIYNQASPLAAEEMLERYRWALLDDLEVGHYFDLQKLIVYMIRIAILTRKAHFSRENGVENFARIYCAVTEEKIGDTPEN